MLSSLDSTIVATMLPTISRDFDGAASYSWVGNAYLLTSTALAPIWGKVSDIFGRKRLLIFCVLEFMATSALAAVSVNMPMLITARALQGIGGGGISGLTMAIIGEIISPRERGKYQGILASTTGLGAVMGPLVGGLMTDKLNWRYGFWINLPIGFLTILGYHFAISLPAPRGSLKTQLRRVDWLGIVLSTASIAVFLLGLTWGGTVYPWASGQVLGLFAVAVVVGATFVWWELRAVEPVIPPVLFKERNYALVNVVFFCLGFTIWSVSYFVPVYFQEVLFLSPTDSGVQNLPYMGFFIVFSMLCGYLVSWSGQLVIFPRIGLLIATVALGLLSMLRPDSSKFMQILPQALVGAGLGWTNSPSTVYAQVNSPTNMIGPGTTVVQFTRALGSCVGIAAFTAVYSNVVSVQLPDKITGVATQYKLTPAQVELFEASYSSSDANAGALDLSSIPSDALSSLRSVLSSSRADGLHYAFVAAVPFTVVGWATTLWLRHVPLRTTAVVKMQK
ncbi:MFS general substrate transporter [Gonapodya prolifera JEL478]|uniref:MFS general substrate transporter n=1 Tax=Gonapodya prolifera (strain JEL478) TaxID=1344416 RepID=A0A139AQ30_GONPJ|nr:MFS general substrate transporter [Gonapodya prolifera JEL478]|eukprot:KXS18613.1 MFS general substrate transporter [Gonapodya prolifera JEL478]